MKKRPRTRSWKEFSSEIKKLIEKEGGIPSYNRIKELRRYDLIWDAFRLCGGWRKTYVSLGYDGLQKEWDKARIISELKRLSKELGHSPKRKELRNTDYYDLSRAAERHFGCWSDALRAAGLETHRKTDWTRKECLEIIKTISEKIGHSPSMNELRKMNEHGLLNALFKFYPTYNDFLKAAGLDIILEMNKWSKEKIIEELIELKDYFGRVPRRAEIESLGRLDLKMAIILHFGCWNNAIRAAGFIPNSDAIGNDFWKRWESFVMRICEKKFRCCEFHKYLPNKSIPDVYIQKKDMIIEVKLNASDHSIKDDIKRYLPYCKRIQIWYLYGKPLNISEKNVTYVGPNKIRKHIIGNNQLLKEFNSIRESLK